jgi:Tfp pilus assembly protein PilP
MLLLLPNVSCKKEQPAVKKPKAEKIEKAAEVKGLEETRAIYEEEYKYDLKGRRDPFLSLVAITKERPIKKKGASPFESYDVDEIKLVAIAWDADKHYALIMLPNGKAYTITEGMTLGLQGGKITKINRSSVVVREYIKDFKGDLKPRDSLLKLHKGEEE